MDDERDDRPGLLSSLGRTLSSTLGLIETRLELLGNDLALAQGDLTKLVIVTASVVLSLQLGILLGVIFLILVVPESARAFVVGICSILVIAGSFAGVLWLRHWLKTRPGFFEATIEEFKKDRERLRGRT
jgi:uncharacterized membrane protein YqjE